MNKYKMIHVTDIKQTIRSLYRSKFLTSINILGLGIGLGSVLLLTTFLIHEFSFDRFHSKAECIYRIIQGTNGTTYYAMGEAIANEIPEVEKVCRLTNLSDVYTVIFSRDNESYPINSFIAANPSIFEMLDFEWVQRPADFNQFAKNQVFISDRMALRFFSQLNVVGQNMEFYIANQKQMMQVAGVYKHLPTYSSLQADFICDISVAMAQFTDLEYTLGLRDQKRTFNYYTDWNNHNDFTTFILLYKNAAVAQVEKKCADIFIKHREDLKDNAISLQSYTQMYLQSQGLDNVGTLKTSRFESLRIFLSIGILILLVAVLNYILISSSEQEQSYNALACRKVNGASGAQIVWLIMLRTLLVTITSLIPAFIFVQMAMPLFNTYFQTELHLGLLLHWHYLVALLLICIVTAGLAGAYLSFLATKTNPARLLQKNISSLKIPKFLNQSLVVFQFLVFILLMSCLLVMKRQMNFSLKTNMGFETRNLMVVELGTEKVKKQYQAIINQVKQMPHVLNCQPTTYFLPPNDNILFASFKDEATGEAHQQEAIFVAAGNAELIKIPLMEGTGFTEPGNQNNIMINQAAATKYGVKAGDNLFHFQVNGILADFHYKSVHESIRPLFVIQQTAGFTHLLIQTDGSNAQVAEQVKKIIVEMEPGYYFESELLNDRVAAFYETDQQHTRIITFFSFVALALSFMGLFGFVTLALTKRIKEIGIRKINGARVTEILLLLNREFIIWVFVAFIIATPVAWYAMHRWLESFAYKAPLSWWLFTLSGIIALVIALLTVSFQSWKAATRNPVEALRYE